MAKDCSVRCLSADKRVVQLRPFFESRCAEDSAHYSTKGARAYDVFRLPTITSTIPPTKQIPPNTGGNGMVFCFSAVA